jgi:hypothetical protein
MAHLEAKNGLSLSQARAHARDAVRSCEPVAHALTDLRRGARQGKGGRLAVALSCSKAAQPAPEDAPRPSHVALPPSHPTSHPAESTPPAPVATPFSREQRAGCPRAAYIRSDMALPSADNTPSSSDMSPGSGDVAHSSREYTPPCTEHTPHRRQPSLPVAQHAPRAGEGAVPLAQGPLPSPQAGLHPREDADGEARCAPPRTRAAPPAPDHPCSDPGGAPPAGGCAPERGERTVHDGQGRLPLLRDRRSCSP